MPDGLPFSEGMRAGDLFFLSGQLGTLPGKLELNNKTAEDEFRQVMENVFSTLKANGLGAKNVVKCLVMLSDMKDWPAFNKIYLEYFKAPYPARSAFGANGLALNARVELEVVAMQGET
ncbi:MAG: RidA family protein [Xanthobacteraceae bacterium]|nr:RidA family protein [Xanthobacteraceae bacterium]